MQCPLCRAETILSQVPSVKNSEKVMQYLNNVNVSECDRHELPLTYLCRTCNDNKPICIYCYYNDHDITHELYLCSSKNDNDNKVIESVYNEINKLKNEIINKQNKITNVNDKINEVNKIRNDNIMFLNKLITYLKNKYNDIINKLNQYKQTLYSDINEINHQINQLRYYKHKQQEQFPMMCDTITKIEINAITQSCFSNIINDINYTPSASSKEKKFTVVYDNYPSMLGQNICIIHQVIYIDTIKFAVCFFPNGNKSNPNYQGKHVSIYLYILDPLDNKSSITLQMKIEMLTDDIFGVNESKTAIPTFNRNRICAGWLNYCEIDKIKNNKFITPNGQLQFNIYIQILDISSFINNEVLSLSN